MKFIQIGAHVGNDEAFEIIKKHNIELGVLIEPLPYLIPHLKENYKNIKNIHIENIAINSSNLDNNFYLYVDIRDPFTQLSSVDKTHLIHHGVPEDKIKQIPIKTSTLEQILDKYSIKELDYLFIDTEGLDCDILLDLDFNKFKINNIYFETSHSDGAFSHGGIKLNSIIEKLKSHNFKYTQINNSNIYAYK